MFKILKYEHFVVTMYRIENKKYVRLYFVIFFCVNFKNTKTIKYNSTGNNAQAF